MRLAILIIDDPKQLGLSGLLEVLNLKYHFSFQTQDSMVHQSKTDEEEFLSFLGGGVEAGYEEDDLQYIHQRLKSPSFYYMEFYRFSFFKDVVTFLSEHFEIMVDDDRGHIYDSTTFFKLEEW